MKILICSDGHAQAERAVRFIASPAAACGAQVTILGIIEHPADEAALTESLRRSAELLRQQGVTVETVTRAGLPLSEIQSRTQNEHYDLVVIGAERKGGGAFALSAKAHHLIKEIEPPVLVMIGQRTTLKKMLICSGGHPYVEKAIQLAGTLASKTKVPVTIFHVLAEAPAVYSDLLEEEAESQKLLASNSLLARNLRKEMGALGALGVEVRAKLRHGFVSSSILQEAEEGEYDMIVTGSAPAGGALRTYVMGNVTSEIVNRADCTVLVVRNEIPGKALSSWRWFTGFFGRSRKQKSKP